jgi:hypothetical protein
MPASSEIWVHDTRVDGTIPNASGRQVIRVDQAWSAAQISSAIAAAGLRAGGATTLWLVFHASFFGVSASEPEGGWEDSLVGGLGGLGEGVTSRNVTQFGLALKGIFSDSIRILACGAGARWNGMEICKRLAFHSQTTVIASQDTQEYTVD